MSRFLITGGAGFVGRRFVRRLLESGHDVVCVDSVVPLTGGIDPGDTWPLFDPRDFQRFSFLRQDCRQYFEDHPQEPFDYAFHLAAMVGGREMIERNPLAVAEDLSIDAEYWRWARSAQPGKTICFSSSAAYPIKLQRKEGHRLLREDDIGFEFDIGMPDMSYGWAKLTHEYLARLAYQHHGLKSVTYRPFSGYGEDQDMAYPFPSICKRVLDHRGASELTVWGSGDQMRDFIYIEDCVDGVLKTMDAIDDGAALNLSTGIFTSFKDFARLAAKVAGYTPEVHGTSNKPEGVFARGGDTTRQAELGFTYTTSFESGIRKAFDHLERNLTGSRA